MVVLVFGTFAISAYANHSWGGYHWARTSNPFSLKLGDNLTSVWDPILATTSSDWSSSSVLDTTVVTGQAVPKTCKATLGRVEVCNSKYGNNGWLGIAQIWITGGTHITQGTTKLNDTYFNTPQYNTTAWRNLVTCQEVGHTLGLDHQDENFNNANLDTCMDYTNNPGTNQHPNAHDYDQLASIYAHLDTINTSNMNLPTGNKAEVHEVNTDDKSTWGKSVAQDPKGRDNVFEKDLGHGNKVLTHVFWVE